MPPRLLPLLHVIPQILASLTNLMPEFRLGLAIDQRATGHPGQKFRHLRADTGNARQCPAMTAQLRRQTGQNLGERLCNPAAHQPLSQHRRLIPDIPARFRCLVNLLHRLDRATPQANGTIDQCQRRFLLGLLGQNCE